MEKKERFGKKKSTIDVYSSKRFDKSLDIIPINLNFSTTKIVSLLYN